MTSRMKYQNIIDIVHTHKIFTFKTVIIIISQFGVQNARWVLCQWKIKGIKVVDTQTYKVLGGGVAYTYIFYVCTPRTYRRPDE